jgi:hypothetical protein
VQLKPGRLLPGQFMEQEIGRERERGREVDEREDGGFTILYHYLY